MSRGGAIIEDVVSPLLRQVAEAKCLLASKLSGRTHNGFSAVDGLLGDIEGEVLLIKESFQRLEMWMKDVENELGVVAKQMDNILEGTTGRRVFDSELQNIHKNISLLREHVTGPLDKLHCNTFSVPAPCKGLAVNSLPTEENELGVVANQMDNILEGTTGRRVFDSELQNIHKNISVLREHATEPLDKLHCNTSSVPASCKGLAVNSLPTEENEFGVVAKQMDNILEGTTERRVFDSELQNIHKNISLLREHVPEPLDKLYCIPAPCKGLAVNSLPTELQSVVATRRCEVAKKHEKSSPIYFYDMKLSPILEACLLTLAIFPQDSIIEKRLLIHWWVGEGLVTPTGNHMAEEIGDGYIRDLITEGLILPVNRAHSSEVTHCRVKSWVRERVIIYAMLCKAFSFNSSRELIEHLSSSPRTCLTEPPTTEQSALNQPGMLATTSDFNPDNFTTCFNVDRRILRFKKKEFMSMRNATVLQLGRWQTSAKHHIEVVSSEFLEWLACFERLRYLSLRGISNIRKLPRSIGELTDLRILDLQACHNLESLPVEITMLKKLTYLDVSECYLLDDMPEGLGSLQDLRVLKGFVVGNSRSRYPCQLGELAGLNNLRKLSISIGRDSVAGKRDFHQLSQLRALRSLTITWGAAAEPPSNGVSRAVLPGMTGSAGMQLSPPPNLIKLDLRCFPGKTAPEWLTSEKNRNLRKLYIRGGGLCHLGVGVKSVEVLRLRFLTDFRMEEPELLEAFPRLVAIEIHQCNMLRSTVRTL